MQSYRGFSVFPRTDQVSVWRERDQAEPIASVGQKQRLAVVSREGDFYCVRIAGIGYGYVRADEVVSETDAKAQSMQPLGRPAYAGAGGGSPVGPYSSPGFSSDPLTGFAPVGFVERLLAYLIDFTILFVIYYVIAMLLDVQRPGFHAEPTVMHGVATKRYSFTLFAGGGLGFLVSFVAGLTYWIGSWSAFGATPGKMLLGQEIVHAETGQPIGIGAAVLRYIGTIISGIPLGLGYLWIIWDGQKQGWHDKIANTRVIRTR